MQKISIGFLWGSTLSACYQPDFVTKYGVAVNDYVQLPLSKRPELDLAVERLHRELPGDWLDVISGSTLDLEYPPMDCNGKLCMGQYNPNEGRFRVGIRHLPCGIEKSAWIHEMVHAALGFMGEDQDLGHDRAELWAGPDCVVARATAHCEGRGF